MRELARVDWKLLPCTQFQRLQSQEPWLSSAQFPSGYEAVLGWVLCHLESRVPQAMKENPRALNIWKCEDPSEVYTENNHKTVVGWGLLTIDLPTCGGISHLQEQMSKRSNKEHPRSTGSNFHQELHNGVTNWKLNRCHNNTPKDFC